MRRLRAKFAALLVALTAAALLPGAAVFGNSVQRVEKCGGATEIMPTPEEINASKIIVVGTIRQVNGTAAFITPQAFLKGPVTTHDIVIEQGHVAGCAAIPIGTGGHVLLMLGGDGPTLGWPLIDSPGAYALENGHAISLNPANHQTAANAPTESALVDHIRSITGQYAVPAQSNSQGASLDWLKVVVPVTVVVLIVFGIGLYLMKIWHRIDPT